MQAARRIAIVLTGLFLLLQPLSFQAQATTTSPAGGTAETAGCHVGDEVIHPNWVAYYNNEGDIGTVLKPPPGESAMTVNDFGFQINSPGPYAQAGSGPSMGNDAYGPLVYPLEGNRTRSFNVSDNTLTDPKLWMGDPTQVSWTLATDESWSFKDSHGTVWYGYGSWRFEGAQFYYSGHWHFIPATYPYHTFKAPHNASIPWYRVCARWDALVPAAPLNYDQGAAHRDVRAIYQPPTSGGWAAFAWIYWVGGSCVLGLLTWLLIVRPRRRHRRALPPAA